MNKKLLQSPFIRKCIHSFYQPVLDSFSVSDYLTARVFFKSIVLEHVIKRMQ